MFTLQPAMGFKNGGKDCEFKQYDLRSFSLVILNK